MNRVNHNGNKNLPILAWVIYLLTILSCQSSSTLDTDSILRATQHLPVHFMHEEVDAVVAIYADSATILTTAELSIRGKELIRRFWSRYLNPLDMHIRHHGFFLDGEACRKDGSIPRQLIDHLPVKVPEPGHTAVIQWAEWSFTYEAEDGVIRRVDQPSLILWISGPDGWRIEWMALV